MGNTSVAYKTSTGHNSLEFKSALPATMLPKCLGCLCVKPRPKPATRSPAKPTPHYKPSGWSQASAPQPKDKTEYRPKKPTQMKLIGVRLTKPSQPGSVNASIL